ncbi:MAG TPA: glycosyltransferase family 2 protein [Candidatus Sulfotelmatobacter sp.]|nr:glycosyltransferase family 2 protein [Candidatus Sulfotelmatobacter sp.]
MHLTSFGPKPEITVIVPCFNEEVVLPETSRRLTASLEQIGCSFEIIFVDDGSRDDTPRVLTGLHAADPRIRIVRLSRNFGHQIAISAGLEYARGAAVVLIDADLQDPPEVIGEMVELWREGNDVVYGTRSHREGETAFKTLTAKWFYRFINRLSEIEIPLDSGDFRLLDRKVVDALVSMPERDRFVRGMVSWTGFKQVSLPYERAARHAGDSKYTLLRMARFAADGILSFSIAPLRLATLLGVVSSSVALLAGLTAIGFGLAQGRWVSPWAWVLLAVLLLGGAQLLCLGIFGEYLGRSYAENKRRPLYFVRETLGFDEPLSPSEESLLGRQLSTRAQIES